MNEKAKKYQYQKLALSLAKTGVSCLFLFLIVATGISRILLERVSMYSATWYGALFIFILVLGIADGILTSPLSYLSGYSLEHRYGLSNQSFARFLWESAKSAFLMASLGIPILFLFYYLLIKAPRFYWAYLAAFLFLFSVLLAQIAPKVILPLFYKLKPIHDESLSGRLKKLCLSEGFTLKAVMSFDMSKNTRKANAAFLGLGKTRTIILADTLLEKFIPEEIEGVFAHEMGHCIRRHIFKQLLIGLILNFGGLFLVGKIYEWTLVSWGGKGPTDLAVLPLFFFYLILWGLTLMPLGNFISRRFEWEADEFARMKSLEPPQGLEPLQGLEPRQGLEPLQGLEPKYLASSFEKLAEMNLADPSPPRWVEILFYSHPAIDRRIAHVLKPVST